MENNLIKIVVNEIWQYIEILYGQVRLIQELQGWLAFKNQWKKKWKKKKSMNVGKTPPESQSEKPSNDLLLYKINRNPEKNGQNYFLRTLEINQIFVEFQNTFIQENWLTFTKDRKLCNILTCHFQYLSP